MNKSYARRGYWVLFVLGILLLLAVQTRVAASSSVSLQDNDTERHPDHTAKNSPARNFFAVLSDSAKTTWGDLWQRDGSLEMTADPLPPPSVAEEVENDDENNVESTLRTEEGLFDIKRMKRRLQLKKLGNYQRSRVSKQGLSQHRRNEQRKKFMKTVARSRMNRNRRMNEFRRIQPQNNREANTNEAKKEIEKPNIILIVADDLGFNDVPWHNPDVQAPNLLRLARKGIMLENHYVLPLCTPSRTALLTGDYPFRHGKQAGDTSPLSPTGLNASVTLLPQRLKDLGYSTHLIGKWHLGYCSWDYTPTRRGFDSFYGFYLGSQTYYTQYKKLGHKKGSPYWLGRNEVDFDDEYEDHPQPPRLPESLKEEQLQEIKSGRRHQLPRPRMRSEEENGGRDFRFNENPISNVSGIYSNDLYAMRAEEVIREHEARSGNAKKPLFLMLSMQAVHGPVQVPLKYRRRYTASTRNLARRTFLGMVSALDEVVGRVVNQLKASGLYRNTIIAFTTDNGGNIQAGGNNFPLRGNKGGVFEGGTRGVAFIHSPLLPKSGYKYTGLMHIVDWHDTLLHVAQSGTTLPRENARRRSEMSPAEEMSGNRERRRDSLNMWTALLKNSESPRQSFVYNVRKKPLRGAIRRKNWKLIVGEGGRYDGWVPPTSVSAGGARELDDGKCCSSWHSSILSRHVMLYNLKDDPLETTDVSYLHPDVTATLKSLLRQYAAESRHPYMPPDNPLGHPKLHGGFFSPGWCQAIV